MKSMEIWRGKLANIVTQSPEIPLSKLDKGTDSSLEASLGKDIAKEGKKIYI